MSSRVPVVRFASGLFALLAIIQACLCLGGCASGRRQFSSGTAVQATGSVHGGRQPIAGALIQLYAAGTTGDGSSATPLIGATITTSDGTSIANANANAGNANNTLPAGFFTITGAYTCPSPTAQVYLVATGGNPGLPNGGTNPQIALMAALGDCGNLNASTSVQVSELTTVASMASLYSFMSSYSAVGAAPGSTTQLTSDFSLVPEYGDISNGAVPGPALPAGYYASSTEIRTLADIVAACVNSSGGTVGDTTACGQLFTLTTASNGTAPADTVQAVLNILQTPTINTAAIFGLLPATAPYQPTLATAPQSWALPITADGTPAKLAFTVQPTNSVATGTLSPVVVTIEDGNGNPVTTATGAVTLTLGNARGATLNGTVTVNAVNGVATFSDLSITKAATLYALTASEPGLASATSASFTVSAGAAAKLSFFRLPTTASSGSLGFPAVQTLDAYGNLVRGAVPITVALGANPTGATLSGTTTVTSSSGVAGFSNLSVNYPATGYTLVASSPGLTSVSAGFDIVGAVAFGLTSYELGQTGVMSIPLSIAAPPGGVTFTLSSDNPSVLSVPATAFVPGGSTVLTTSTAAYASHIGAANVTISGANYATKTNAVTVTTRLTVNDYGITTYAGLLANSGVSISGIAPPEGLTLNVTIDKPSIATAPATVTIPAGASTAPLQLTGAGAGSTTLRVSYPGTVSAAVPVSGQPTPPITIAHTDVWLSQYLAVGNNMYTGIKLTVPAGPPADETVTLTSSDTSHFLLTTDPTQIGSASVTVPLARNATTMPTVYLQGMNFSGTSSVQGTLTVTAAIYGTNTRTMYVWPSGLVFSTSGSLTTTNISAPSPVTPILAVLLPGSLLWQSTGYQFLGPQASPITYTVSSFIPSVGTIADSQQTIPVGAATSTTSPSFQPITTGSTLVYVTEPVGYYAGNFPGLWASQINVTVAQAAISMRSPVVGNNSYEDLGLSLLGRPPQNETMTLTSSDPSHFLLTTDIASPGHASVTVQLTQNDATVPPVWVQGQNFTGSAAINGTITATAANYADGLGTPALYPTGIGFTQATTTGSVNSGPLRLTPSLLVLDPATLGYLHPANTVNPQAGPITFTITSSNPAVGGIVNSPVTIPTGLGGTVTSNYPGFQPTGDGTATVTIQQPAGYFSPTGYYTDQLTMTITN